MPLHPSQARIGQQNPRAFFRSDTDPETDMCILSDDSRFKCRSGKAAIAQRISSGGPFALSLWKGRDPILKERLFGLTNRESNHGEDIKESASSFCLQVEEAAFGHANPS